MKKSLLILLLLPLLSFCQKTQNPFTFQGLNWGDTETEVKLAIPDLHETETGLSKTTTINHLSASLLFEMNNNLLERISYMFSKQHSNENSYIEDLKKIKNLLIKKYGTPNIDTQKWNNDLLKNDESRYGLAVSSGHLEYVIAWTLHDTNILLNLASHNNKVIHRLVYKSI
ncbi:hypothetical protein Q4Q35_20420 [Flavivirga aquimarina]|uniref:Uncharacterized protein n=1 Tax=Flavivirga aquimarina TaxID=2027862 RepID=A0ABT8WGH1_9FLAO|nr:hypothetical protein [Flavivirga aquimarina]MDO5972172.1 hypothetical protein [Flavivirga aquimarina]